MLSLSNDQKDRRTAIVDFLNAKAGNVESIVARINKIIVEELNVSIGEYNSALSKAIDFRADMVQQMAKTEVAGGFPTEGERRAYADWRGEWEELDLEPVEPVLGFEGPEVAHAEDLNSLSTEPEVPF